jgi:hypothetical protein
MTKMLKNVQLKKKSNKKPYIASLNPKKDVQALEKAFSPEIKFINFSFPLRTILVCLNPDP